MDGTGSAPAVRPRLGWLRRPQWLRPLLFGLIPLGPIYGAVGLTGGLASSPAQPVVYLWLAVVTVLLPTRASAGIVAMAVLSEVGLFFWLPGTVSWPALTLHVVLMLVSSGLFGAVLWREVRSLRRRAEEAIAAEFERMEADAADFRLSGDLALSNAFPVPAVATAPTSAVLTAAPEGRATTDSAMTAAAPAGRAVIDAAMATAVAAIHAREIGSVRVIREGLFDILHAARVSVRADRTTYFALDAQGKTLYLKGQVGSSNDRAPPLGAANGAGLHGSAGGSAGGASISFSAAEGPLAAVVRTEMSIHLLPSQRRHRVGTFEVVGLMAVPVFHDRNGVRSMLGVLMADRDTSVPFTEHDTEVLAALGRELGRAVDAERLFVAMDRVKYEQERLYEAFSLLNDVRTPSTFADKLLEAVARIRRVAFLAFTSFDSASDEHLVVSVSAVPSNLALSTGANGSTSMAHAHALVGQCFSNRTPSLVGLALRAGLVLPCRAATAGTVSRDVPILGDLPMPRLDSVKVFPLCMHGAPLGAVIVGTTQTEGGLLLEDERMIEMVTSHASVTLSNVRLFEEMAKMATTDGLTGLTNHRRFKSLLRDAIERAQRFGRQVSVVMVDADHFKGINDTYGHAVGDLVLIRIAELLRNEARRTDVVARYGGEEFVLVLDETDRAGALALAERVRSLIEAEQIRGDFGVISVTASFGVSTWPDQAHSPEGLVERADEALYEAKRAGRNRVIASSVREVHCPDPTRAAIGRRRVQA